MTESNIYQLIKNLAKREEITEKEVVDMLSLAIQEIYCQKKSASEKLSIIFDPEKKQFMTYQTVKQVENYTSEENLFQESKFQPLNLKELTDYKEILQYFRLFLQKNRQKKLMEELQPLQGKIVEGTIQEVYHNYCLVKLLDRKELAYWGKSEWLSYNAPPVGQSQRFLVKEVKTESKYPIILARRSEEFLRKLLVIEIREIAQGKIIVQNILRWPELKTSKVIVGSQTPMKNLLGACIGEGGLRAKNIEEEMNPERINFIELKGDKKEQLIKLLFPVEVLGFCKLQKKDDLVVIVRPEQLSLALVLKEKIAQLLEIKMQILTWEKIDKKNAVIIEMVKGRKDSNSLTNYPKYE